jgi:hypothetical protein
MQDTIQLTDITINKTKVDWIDLDVEWFYTWEKEIGGYKYREIYETNLIQWSTSHDDELDDDDIIDWFEFNQDIIERELLEK